MEDIVAGIQTYGRCYIESSTIIKYKHQRQQIKSYRAKIMAQACNLKGKCLGVNVSYGRNRKQL